MSRAHRESWHRHALAIATVWITAAWIWRHALGTFFTSDDLVSMARAAGIEPTPHAFRPLSAILAARIQYAAFGLAPAGYHAVNLALHLLATAGVYALALRLTDRWRTAMGAAALFACSGIAFTPLHAASGVGDLLACVLLLAATLLHLEGRRRERAWLGWAAAAVAVLAVLAKESAVAWPLVVLALEWRRGGGALRVRAILPALAAGIATALWLVMAGQARPPDPVGPYALDFSPAHLAANLATYLDWCAAIGTPIRDVVAAADPASVGVALGVGLAAALALGMEWGAAARPVAAGLAWWFAFLLPVLPLAHHTYLYYLYLPWAGGAIALAAAGAALIGAGRGAAAKASRAPDRARRPSPLPLTALAVSALAAFVALEARAVTQRERATFDALPADRTLREAILLAHALPALRAAALPPGTAVGFVNPAPRDPFHLPGVAPGRRGEVPTRSEYVPLEMALGSGRALRLFAPGLVDSGFATTIPPGWDEVECFLYEQRGWLRRWGRGQEALMRQGEFQAASGRWVDARSSFARVRALGDTVPAALCGEAVALARLGRAAEARALAEGFARRWPADPRGPVLRAVAPSGTPDPRLIRPFDGSLPEQAGR